MKRFIKGRKIAMLVLSAVLFIGISSPIETSAKDKKDFTYVSLGDSIATGYGLPDYVPGVESRSAYTSLLKQDIGATDMVNFAVDGMNSTQLLQALNNETKGSLMYDKLLNAKIITLTIGSNDVLQPFLGVLANEFGADVRDLNKIITDLLNSGETGQLELIAKFENLNRETTGLRNNKALNTGVEMFSKNFPEIIKKLKAISPNAEIYVTNIYNPYEEVEFKNPINQTTILDLDSIAEEYTDKLNDVFSSNSLDYSLIDIENKFNDAFTDKSMKHPLVNVDIANYNFDPHPNLLGHTVIADSVSSYIKENSTNYKLKDLENKNIKVFVNGKQLKTDVSSQIVNDRALVSIRAISEAIGAKIEWTQKTKTVTVLKDNKNIKLQIGSKKAYIDGKEVTLDAAAILKNDTTLVPIRFIAESFGADVSWDHPTRTVIIRVKK